MLIDKWCMNVNCEIVSFDIDVDKTTVQRWYKKLNNMFLAKINYERPLKIGGPGKIIEFDETLLMKPKYNCGRILRGQKLVVCIVEHGNRENFLIFCVPHRSRKFLIPLFENYILPGSTVMTDDWGAYRRLE